MTAAWVGEPLCVGPSVPSLRPGPFYNTLPYCLSAYVSITSEQVKFFQIWGVSSSISSPTEGAPPLRNSLMSLQLFILTCLAIQHLAFIIASCPVFLKCYMLYLILIHNKIGGFAELVLLH